MSTASNMGQRALQQIVGRYPRLARNLAGWAVVTYDYNTFVKWTHPTVRVTVTATPDLNGGHTFGISVGNAHDVVAVNPPAVWQANAVERMLVSLIDAVVTVELQETEAGRHGLVEVIEIVETVKASWGPLLRYRSVCECGWKSEECYPKDRANDEHATHVTDRCGSR